MDEVLEQLQSTTVSQDENDKKSEFELLYKNSGRQGQGQEERRKEILEIQKSNRRDNQDRIRGIIELVTAVEEENIYKSRNKVQYRPKIYVAGFTRASPTYSNVLMLSEWMVEKPTDFHENWYVTPCPKGARMLVVAYQGSTRCYSRHGQFKLEIRTELPGGCPSTNYIKKCCVLDCFYHKESNTMYILDLLAWNNQPMTDCETEFRHYWLETQLSEIPGLKVINKQKNMVLFSLLPKILCTPDRIDNFMQTYPSFPDNTPELDGLLFYHKGCHYVAGETPLVGWLYPYMVQEVLGSEITVHEAFLAGKPEDYVNQADFIEKFQDKFKKKNKIRRSSTNDAMDTTDITQTKIQIPDTLAIPQNFEYTEMDNSHNTAYREIENSQNVTYPGIVMSQNIAYNRIESSHNLNYPEIERTSNIIYTGIPSSQNIAYIGREGPQHIAYTGIERPQNIMYTRIESSQNIAYAGMEWPHHIAYTGIDHPNIMYAGTKAIESEQYRHAAYNDNCPMCQNMEAYTQVATQTNQAPQYYHYYAGR